MNRWAKDRLLARWSVGKLWLESGYADLRVPPYVSPIFAPSVEAASLYYPGHVKNSLNETIPYIDEAVSEDSDPKRGYTKAMDSLSFGPHTAGPGVKRTQWISNRGTEFTTGKLRLAVQSQYGAKDKNDDTDLAIPLAEYAIPNTASKTHALYSGSATEPDYWLLTITANTVTARHLSIPSAARNKLYDRLAAANDAERVKIEAYLLTKSKFDDAQPMLSDTFTLISGSPFAYGWKSNSLGTELAIVTNEGVFDEIDTPYHYTCRLYRMSVSITQDNNGSYSLSVTVTKNEETNCTPQNNIDIVWQPNLQNNWMQTFNWHPSGTPADKYVDGLLAVDDAPFYAFYNAADELVVFRYYMAPNESDSTVASISQDRANWEKSETLCKQGDKSGENNWAVEYVISGFYVDAGGGAAPSGLDQKTGAYFVDYEFSVTANGTSNASSPAATPGWRESSVPGYCGSLVDDSWLDGTLRYPIVAYEADFSLTRKRADNAAITGDSVLVIPFGDDSCYHGTLIGLSGLMTYHDATNKLAHSIESTHISAENSSLFAASGDGGAVAWGVGVGAWVANSALHNAAQYEQEYAVNFTLYHRHGNESAVTLEVASSDASDQDTATTAAYFQLGSWAAWFDPPINDDPTLTPLLEVQESYGSSDEYTLLYTRDPTAGNDRYAVTDDELPEDVRPLNDGIFLGWI